MTQDLRQDLKDAASLIASARECLDSGENEQAKRHIGQAICLCRDFISGLEANVDKLPGRYSADQIRWVEFGKTHTGLYFPLQEVHALWRLLELTRQDSTQAHLLASYLQHTVTVGPAWPMLDIIHCLQEPFETMVEITDDLENYSTVPLMVGIAHLHTNPHIIIRHAGDEYGSEDMARLMKSFQVEVVP